jgi:hypothetical protein
MRGPCDLQVQMFARPAVERGACLRPTSIVLPLRDVVTHRMPLERATEALETAQADKAMKVVFAPNGGED